MVISVNLKARDRLIKRVSVYKKILFFLQFLRKKIRKIAQKNTITITYTDYKIYFALLDKLSSVLVPLYT